MEEILYHNDQHCDDGGDGWEFSTCPHGTDCTDCGPRIATHMYECKQVAQSTSRRGRSRSLSRRELSFYEQQACQELREEHGDLLDGECFLSFYDISRHNEMDFTIEQRRTIGETYMCYKKFLPPPPPMSPPPPEPLWTTNLALVALTASVSANPDAPENALLSEIRETARSVAPSAAVTLEATEALQAGSRQRQRQLQLQQEGTNSSNYSWTAPAACETDPKTRLTYRVDIPMSSIESATLEQVSVALAERMSAFAAILGTDALCSGGDDGFRMANVYPKPPPLPPPSPCSQQGISCFSVPCCAPLVCHQFTSMGVNQPTCDHESPPPPPPGEAAQVTLIDLEDEHHQAVNAVHMCTPFETALYYQDTASTGATLAYYMLVAHDPTGNGGTSTCEQGFPSDTTTDATGGTDGMIRGAMMPNTDLPMAGPGVSTTFDYYMHSVFAMGTQSPYLRVWVPTLNQYCSAAFIQPSADFMQAYSYVWNEWPLFSADGTLHVPSCVVHPPLPPPFPPFPPGNTPRPPPTPPPPSPSPPPWPPSPPPDPPMPPYSPPPCQSALNGGCDHFPCCEETGYTCTLPTNGQSTGKSCKMPPPPPPPPGGVAEVTLADLEAEHLAAVGAEHVCTPHETALYYADGEGGSGLSYRLMFAHDPTGNGGASTCDDDYHIDVSFHTGSPATIGGVRMPNAIVPTAGAGVTVPPSAPGGNMFDTYTHSTILYGMRNYLRVWNPTLSKYCSAHYVTPSPDFTTTYGTIFNEWPIFAADGTLHVPSCNPAPS